jgi:hypothetical protein
VAGDVDVVADGLCLSGWVRSGMNDREKGTQWGTQINKQAHKHETMSINHPCARAIAQDRHSGVIAQDRHSGVIAQDRHSGVIAQDRHSGVIAQDRHSGVIAQDRHSGVNSHSERLNDDADAEKKHDVVVKSSVPMVRSIR